MGENWCRKRVLPGSSSTCTEEAEVVEISPPASRSSKSKSSRSQKNKEVFCPEIIDVDMDEDCMAFALDSRQADISGKGKQNFSDSSLGSLIGTTNHATGDVMSSEKNHITGSQYLVDLDDLSYDVSNGESEYMDIFNDDQLHDDQYAFLQSHFDNLGIPPGVEVPIPWFNDDKGDKMMLDIPSTSTHSMSQIQLNPVGFSPWIDSSPSSWSLEFEQANENPASGGSSAGGKQFQTVDQPQKLKLSPPLAFVDNAPSQKLVHLHSKSTKDHSNCPTKVELQKSFRFHESSHSKRKLQASSNMVGSSSRNQFSTGADNAPKTTKHVGNGGLYDRGLNMQTGTKTVQHGVLRREAKKSFGHSSFNSPYLSGPSLAIFSDQMTYGPWYQEPMERLKNATGAGDSSESSSIKRDYGNPEEILKKFELFKKFDTVQDYSDHYYSQQGSSLKQPSKSWAKKIQEEWRILEKDLPDTIFVRVYESRMDLLRAVIIGAEGTPYHDGLFFFDVFFPEKYPNCPPQVHYHAGGLRINPNLYCCGKVCLSLLNTWSGSQKEKWIPGVSTILQVLVSIQGLILNAKPFFNEPGYADMSGTPKGEKSSLEYNERTFIYSLKTMVYSIRRPPKYFEDFVAGHFYKYAHDILVACKAYSEGAQVGCLVKGGVQDVDEGDKSSSKHFKDSLAGYIKTVVDAFAQVGAKDCENFLSLAQNTSTSRPVSASPWITDYY